MPAYPSEISRAASARAAALCAAASPRSLTEASARARLTRSMVAIPVTMAMSAIATTRMPNTISHRSAWWLSSGLTPGANDRKRSTSAAANGTASHHSHPATIRYSRREPMKSDGSPLHHRTPSSSEPG